MRTWVLLHDGAPAHRSLLVHNLLTHHNVQVLPHPGYSLDLNPMDYWFFNKVKSKVKGIHHRDVPQLQQSVDTSIGSLTRQNVTEAMDHLPERLTLHRRTRLLLRAPIGMARKAKLNCLLC